MENSVDRDDVRRWTEGGLPAARRIALDRL